MLRFVPSYTVIRQSRRKVLCIAVSSDNKVLVKAPKNSSKKQIRDFIGKKSEWIRKTIEFNREFRKPYIPKKFIDGEPFLYLGTKYYLSLDQSERHKTLLRKRTLFVYVFGGCKDFRNYVSKKVIEWYKIAAYKKLLERVSFYERALKVSISDLQIKTLKRTWGTCSKKGVVIFNWKLIMAPLYIVDYVVVHELCHLIHLNHSNLFWEQVKKVVPRYKQYKKWLTVHENELRF